LQSETNRRAEAMASYELARAVWERLARENPEMVRFASNLGGTLENMAIIDLDERREDDGLARLTRAIDWQRKALTASPRDPDYRRLMINHITRLIRATEGLARADEVDRARLELGVLEAGDPAKAALDVRLATVLKGQAPSDEAERLRLGYRAYERSLHSASARLLAEALANNPKLGDDRKAQHLYNAACAASLAASSHGTDGALPDDAAKAKFRNQAREWLRAELTLWAKVLDVGPAEMKTNVAPTLRHWKADADLVSIRDEKKLTKLPEEERIALKTLWHNVDQLLARAAAGR
jgi:hypothetical protein